MALSKVWDQDAVPIEDRVQVVEHTKTKRRSKLGLKKRRPIHQKKEIVSQMVSLKKENLRASEYAKKSIQELFTPAVLGRALVKEVVTSQNMVAINEGDGKFKFVALPARAQLSCVCGIQCTDLNKDGTLDLLLGGNNYEFKPQYSRLDANYGSVLLNDGAGNFAWQEYFLCTQPFYFHTSEFRSCFFLLVILYCQWRGATFYCAGFYIFIQDHLSLFPESSHQ